jgi:hypothetical protein
VAIAETPTNTKLLGLESQLATAVVSKPAEGEKLNTRKYAALVALWVANTRDESKPHATGVVPYRFSAASKITPASGL